MMKSAMFILLVVGVASLPASAAIMDATTNNGSFELPVAPADHTSGLVIPGWNHPGGNTNFNIRKPGYLVGSTDGTQSMNIVNLAGWFSDVLTTETLVAGETVTMSVDTGWDSWPNGNPPAGATYYLYATDPTNFANQFLMFSFSDTADYNGFGTDAGWSSAQGSALVQGAWHGYYTQVVVASGGTANNLVDNFVITQTPEPASVGLLAASGLAMLRRRRAA